MSIMCPFFVLMCTLIYWILTEKPCSFATGIVFCVGWYYCVFTYWILKKHEELVMQNVFFPDLLYFSDSCSNSCFRICVSHVSPYLSDGFPTVLLGLVASLILGACHHRQ